MSMLYDDEDDEIHRAVFAYLFRSGHIRIVRSSSSREEAEDDSEDDSEDEDYEEEMGGELSSPSSPSDPCCRKRKGDTKAKEKLWTPKKADTSQLEKSELYQYVKLQSGQTLASRPECEGLAGCNTVPSLLRQRQLANSSEFGGFSPAKKAAVASHFLPTAWRCSVRGESKNYCGIFSRNGDVYMSASQDQHIRLFDVTSNDFLLFKDITARDVGWTISDTDYSPDQNYLIYSSWCDSIYLCNIRGDHDTHIPLFLRPPSAMHFCPFSIRFSYDNQEVLAGGNDGFIYIYNRARNDRTVRFSTGVTTGDDANAYDINAVAFADESSHIIFSGGDDGLCAAWDRRTLNESNPKPVGILVGHAQGITFIDPKGDGRHLISNSKDQSIKLWDIRKFCSSKEKISKAKERVINDKWDYRWQPVPKRFKSGVNVPGDTSLMTYRGHKVVQTLVRCRFSPMATTGQRYIYSGCSEGKILIYDLLTGETVSSIRGHRSAVRDVSWHPYHPIMCTSSWDGTVSWWEHRAEEEEGEK